MKQFNDDNFVLETQTAQDLYHNHAAKMPIIDYHCHLIPEMVANDHRFKSITELWLAATTISGARCVRTASTRSTVRARTRRTGRSLIKPENMN